MQRWTCAHAMASGSTSRTPEEQLRSIFSECQLTSRGSLTQRGLQQLCTKLQLGNSTNELLNRLRKHRLEVCGPNTPKILDDPLQDVTFDEFREVFIFLLSEQEHLSSTSVIAHGDMSTGESSYGTTNEGIMESCSDGTLSIDCGADKPESVNNITQPLEELEEKLGETVVQEGTSQPPSLSYSGDNEEEYLRGTWQRLGVGHDGFLSLDELATVCHAIGMEKVASEVLEQLFSRLDVDGDGRISFEEFLHMFQNGGPSGNTSLVLDESQHQEVPGTPLSRMSSVSDDRRGVAGTESGVFSTIDPDNTGFASVETILELWESLSISNGTSLLKEMGFSHRPHDRLSLADLSTALEEECRVTDDQSSPTSVTPVQMAVLTYLHEIKFLRFSLDSARGERNKLRFDLNEANQRLALLAQELDEHNAHMEASSQHQIQELERQYRDQVRELQEAIARERDTARDQVSSVMRELQSQNTQLLQEDSKLKAKLSTLHADIKRLESENMELSEKLQEAERQISQMEKQLIDLQELRKKVAEFESLSPREEEYRRLLDRLERVTAENQQLRDNNDELLSQMDSFPLRQNTARNSDKDSLDGSCLGDYVDPPIGLLAPVKRRGSNSGSGDDSCEEESPRGVKVRRCSKGLNVHYVDVGSYDESFLDTSMSSLLKGGMPGLQNLDTSQPPSLDELSTKVPRKNSGQSDVSEGSSLGIKSASQLLNKELKQVFKQVRASVKEEYKREGSEGCDSDRSYEGESKRMRITTPEELEAELGKLREERDKLAKQLALQQEEFAHQLEKKEFEVEQALTECTGIKEQLEKTTSQLNLSLPETSPPTLHLSSTPIKSSHSAPTSLKDKGQLLTMALEELEMALRREEQERAQRISMEAMLAKRHDGDSSTTDSVGGETTTTYPLTTPSEPSNSAKLLLQGLGVPSGEGRVRVLEEHCRGLEGELARVRVEVLKMVEEREQLMQQKETLEKGADSIATENVKQRCKNLADKIKRKRQAHTSNSREKSSDSGVDDKSEKLEGDFGKSQSSSMTDSSDVKKTETKEDETDGGGEEVKDEIERLEVEVCTLEKDLAHEHDVLEKDKASLLEKNGKLEQDIEILRVELDKSEDYWTLKLQEEQDYYEEERRLYDDKFSALEKKIREYEELVLTGGGNGRDNSDESDRLSTIDESAIWEKQVTDLEEEVALLKRQMDDLREERHNMECGWEARVSEERQKASQECSNLQEQVAALTAQLHQSQLQVNTVLEELDKVRRDSENHIRDLASQNRLNVQLSAPLVNGHDTDFKGRSSPGSSDEERFFLQESGHTGEETINRSLRSQLRQCQGRLRYLEAALQQHHSHAHHILSVTRQQHAAEVQNLESMITATQQMLGQHIAKYKDQLSKASRSDSLVRELYLENAQLMRALQVTESRQKVAEETSRQLQIAALDHTMS